MKLFKILWFGLLITFFIIMGVLVGLTQWTIFLISLIFVSYLSSIWKKRKEIIRLLKIGFKNWNKYCWEVISILLFGVIMTTGLSIIAPKTQQLFFVEFYCYIFIIIMFFAWFYDRGKLIDNITKTNK